MFWKNAIAATVILCFMSDSDMLEEFYVVTYARVNVLRWQVVVELIGSILMYLM